EVNHLSLNVWAQSSNKGVDAHRFGHFILWVHTSKQSSQLASILVHGLSCFLNKLVKFQVPVKNFATGTKPIQKSFAKGFIPVWIVICGFPTYKLSMIAIPFTSFSSNIRFNSGKL